MKRFLREINADRKKMAEQKQTTKPLLDVLDEFSEFPISSYEEWREVAEKSLKGASFEKLLTKTYEGITLKPMYQAQDLKDVSFTDSLPGFSPYVRGTKAIRVPSQPWVISQEILLPVPGQFNEALRYDLARGQKGINLVLDEATRQGLDADEADENQVGKKGVSISTVDDLKEAFHGIHVADYPLFIRTGAVSLPFISLFVTFLKERNVDEKDIKGAIGADPLAALARDGRLPYSLETCYDILADVTKWARKRMPLLETVIVESHPYHNGGGSAVEELAFTLAAAVEYVRHLLERGLSIDDIASSIRFSFSIGANMFMEIAKFRAARMLWATIVKEFAGKESSQKMKVHARTSEWNKTVYDPYVNMLRGAIEAFTGAVSGVDSMHVAPFDEVIRTPNEFSRRIARNAQIILQEEAHLGKVTDPAGGSWYVEALTNEVAKKAWALFQETEAKGGLEKALKEGFVQETIQQTAKKRIENIKRRKETIVGTNRYANPMEERLTNEEEAGQAYETRKVALQSYRQQHNPSASLDQNDAIVEEAIAFAEKGATIGAIAKAIGRGNGSETVAVIPARRGAEPFEELREQMERYVQKTGKRPKIFLANIGKIAGYKARADFVSGFFEVGGFDVLTNNGFDNVEKAVEEALASGAETVVISAKDDDYPAVVPKVANRLKEENPKMTIYLAGKPTEEEFEQYKQAGVDNIVNVQSNCYDVLYHLQQLKGVRDE